MEQCFGSDNVNQDDDASWQSCGAMSVSSGESDKYMEVLPGCNPLTSGPEDAVPQKGGNCGAAPVAGGGETPVASKSSVASYAASSAMASSKVAESSVIKDDTEPSMVFSLPNKHVVVPTPAGSEMYGAPTLSAIKATPAASEKYGGSSSSAKPTPSAGEPAIPPQDDLPSLTLVSSSAGGSPTGTPSDEEDCKAPVYVTVTPTIYVTAGSNTTACGFGTVTKTMTQTATITVPAMGGVEYGSY